MRYGDGVQVNKKCLKTACGHLNLDITYLMVCLILERANRAVNAVIASNSQAARLLLAANQLNDCILRNDQRSPGNSWLPGMVDLKNQWGPDPCAKEKEAVESLQKEIAGNQVPALQNLGAAPAPQLAHPADPTPNTDPAIPGSEFVAPDPGQANPFNPMSFDEIMELIEQGQQELVDDFAAHLEEIAMQMDQIYGVTKKLILWCPWGGPGVRNLKWNYKPNNASWLNKWAP
ncbi:nucleoprotein [Pacific black duck chaphamaparvovirus 1]|uniref:Nucleoprotein n=1 Tax=Pacific black duck chaphamaparvovirus 1 TaxID=2759407 RepID=A0A7D7BK50_9VIRU|nr:nucleoprotein [Pacific black duck chaphamaparvovirus 1]QMI57782.1 nucleoprotein [Pacific black duck chaphamaparvovirus 1]